MICECGNEFIPATRGVRKEMCKSCASNRRRLVIKRKAAEYLGGKCIDCGYDKCIDALEFDHVDPSLKEFQISDNLCVTWDVLEKELDKCVLRCANCHRERHYNEKPKLSLDNVIIEHKVINTCKQCGTQFIHNKSVDREYCSIDCARQPVIEWPDVQDLVDRVKSCSYVHVAKELGVSDNAIRKYFKKNGINPKQVRSIKDNTFKST